MSGYVSGRTVGANHDPEPWLCMHAPRVPGRRHATGDSCTDSRYEPRPEYDVRVNAIIAAYRASDPRGWDAANVWLSALDSFDAFGGFTMWDKPDHIFHPIVTATDEERAWARRVLTKLAALRETGPRRNLCDLCGREWTVLAAFWSAGRSALAEASGYACIECKPESFNITGARHLQPRLLGGAS